MLAILLLFTVLVTGLILTTFLRIQYVRAKERRMIKLANVSPRGFRLFGVESWDWKDFLRLWTPDSYTPEAHVIHAIYQGIARHAKQAELVEAEKQDWYERGRDFDPRWFSDPIPQEITARWQNVSRNTLRESEEEMCWWGISPPQHYHLFLADGVEFTIAPQKIGGPKENRPISLQTLGFMRKLRKGDIFEIEVNMGTWATARDSSGNNNGFSTIPVIPPATLVLDS